MTLFEYYCEKILGPGRRVGERLIFPCPNCGDRTAFGTMPHRPGEYKDRACCHRCVKWEIQGKTRSVFDVYDIMRLVQPDVRYPEQQRRLAAWEKEWKSANGNGHVNGQCAGAPNNSPRTAEGNELTVYQAFDQINRIAEYYGITIKRVFADWQKDRKAKRMELIKRRYRPECEIVFRYLIAELCR